MKQLYLLDAYALIYRAYYGLIRSPRINSKGENTSAIFGFLNTLQDILNKLNPDMIAVVFDPPGGSFRNEMFHDYKAQREETPEAIRFAIPYIKRIIEAYNITIVEVPNYEADDVIGTIAQKAQQEGFEVNMVTPDKDYAQLVDEHIFMIRSAGSSDLWEVLGVPEVCQKYQFKHPTQMIDYLALIGDKADNVPGCPGIGPKTATSLLNEYGSCEGIIENVEKLKGKTKTKIETNLDEIRLSKTLVTIHTNVPINIDWQQLHTKPSNTEALKEIFEELEFKSFLKKLDTTPLSPTPNDTKQMDLFGEFTTDYTNADAERSISCLENTLHEYQLIENKEDALKLRDILLTKQKISLDTETTSLEPTQAKLVGFSFATEDFKAWYISVSRETEEAKDLLHVFKPVFENENILKVGQNLKYDFIVLNNYGIELRGPLFDTMLAHYLIQPELHHNMDFLSETYLNYRPIAIEELIGPKGKKQKNMADLSPEVVCPYAAEDADVTLRLYAPLAEELNKSKARDVFYNIEMPLLRVLAKMEIQGVRIDTDSLHEIKQEFLRRLSVLEKDIYQLAGHEFLISSPRQVGEVLFGELQLNDKAKKTKSGQYQTGEEVLQAIQHRHPIVEKILAYRALRKLLSTYVEALPKLIAPQTQRIHTSFNQAVTATGRLSSSNPNLQNIPIRGEDGREIRRAFVGEPNELFLSADYSQIELRIVAHLSGDTNMIEAFHSGYDIHAATAAKIFKKPIQDITPDERSKAKTANFGIIYGISAFGLSERLNIPRTEAKALIDSYLATYPSIRSFMEKSVATAREKGYIETLFGRRRYLPDINSRNAVVRGYAERNAINAPIQGTAADIIKIAMVRVQQRLDKEGMRAKMILQVHDELNFSVHSDEIEKLRQVVKEEMENACQLSVPLEVECGIGKNWLEAH